MGTHPSRRQFIVGAGAALGSFSLGLHVPLKADMPAGTEINAWIVIGVDETVVLRVARSEMGQGSLTGLAQLVAEELHCAWERMRTEYVSPAVSLRRDGVYGDFQTGGSGSIRESQEVLRMAGAQAREMLVSAAAKGWGVAASECRARAGVVTHAASGRSATYGSLAAAAAVPPRRKTYS